MRVTDNFLNESPRARKMDYSFGGLLIRAILLAVLVCFASCNRMATPPAKQLLKDADACAANGDFLQAINLYETALDGTQQSAQIHYTIAILYDDKMGDPLNAMHHFKRYLTLAPSGPRAEEVKNFMKKDELALLTMLSGDSVVSRAEAARLKNENLTLRKELDERRAETRNAAVKEKAATRAGRTKTKAAVKKRTAKRATPAN